MQRWLLAVVLSGCFSPTYNSPRCSDEGLCPGSLVCEPSSNTCVARGGGGGGDASIDDAPLDDTALEDAMVDAPVDADAVIVDAPPDAAPVAALCDAPSAVLRLCLPFDGSFQDPLHPGAVSQQGAPPILSVGAVGMAAGPFQNGFYVVASQALDNLPRFTVEAFLKRTQAVPNPTYVFVKETDIELYVVNNMIVCGIEGDLVQAPIPPVSQWVHVACTYDNNMARLFVDGVPVGSATAFYQISSGRPIFIGGTPSAQQGRFIGLIDELRVFNVPRSPAEIMAAKNRRVNN